MFRWPDLIRKYAHAHPDKQAVHFEGRDFTWAAFRDRIQGIARALTGLGVKPGDRVAYLGQNSHWLVEMYLAPTVIGGILVPLNYRLSVEEMVAVIADCAPEVLFVDRHYQDIAAQLMAQCPSLKTLVYSDWDPAGPDLPEHLSHDGLIAAAGTVGDGDFDALASASDDVMIIFYTSGTTGVPKGVMLSHNNLLANATGSGHLYGYNDRDRLLLSGPMFHLGTGSRVYTSIAYGTSMVIQPRFEVEETMGLIEAQRVTTMTLVPTMLGMILNHPRFAEFDFSSIRCLTYGAAPMPVTLMERAIEAIPGVVFCQGYGMTETSPVLSVLTPQDHVPGSLGFTKLASVGRPVIYSDLRIVDAEDRPVKQGERGEIIVRGPQVMQGYWNRAEETADALRGGFYHTGDAGYLDADGFLFLAGRTKEMIISGGENVYPIETENCLSRHPAVAQVAVLGLPHEKWGETVHAVVALHAGKDAGAEALIAFAREHIAHYKAPRGVTIWDGPLPLSPTNKIDKNALKRALTAPAGA